MLRILSFKQISVKLLPSNSRHSFECELQIYKTEGKASLLRGKLPPLGPSRPLWQGRAYRVLSVFIGAYQLENFSSFSYHVFGLLRAETGTKSNMRQDSWLPNFTKVKAVENQEAHAQGLSRSLAVLGEQTRVGTKPQVLSTHRNISGSGEFLFMESCFLKPDCDIFGTKTSHKQLFLKGGERKLPTQKINAVDYSESNAEAMERKWEKQIASNVNIILPLNTPSVHMHTHCP